MRAVRECSSCGDTRALVISTRASPSDGRPTVRRYRCPNCSNRWTALEYREEHIERLKKGNSILVYLEKLFNATPDRTDKR